MPFNTERCCSKANCRQAPEPVGLIDESLNELEQDDPKLIDAIRKKYLIEPSTKPYNWGRGNRAGMRTQGQYGQAIFVDAMLEGNLKNGFFIEAGAVDGVRLSNSLHFELRHNWTGLLVEPNPEAFKNLTEKNRKAWLLPQCFSTKTR